ncbi:hypothetical protein [Streptomyces cyaneofuscatus]|uniref:GNAT family N-acetyltransferase n=1 Tax=Streptomyces cyaneofuscatus TaxID=66883 RepID=A0ABZ1EVA7_9ACTN|nr:hypothetical protein [Streptomyces cyaneofuscatus]WSB07995.1 GNAT family N-acetyltransferase [Streptomyces cyaneofuscatus]WSD48472.1 GNAT family N-acetyltransferase [Streptomyces cyaneofuscatus]
MNDHGRTPTPGVTLTAGSLLMRPWRAEDVPALLEAYDDPVMRQWVRLPVSTPEEAARRLELLHQVDNVASCRVAEKSGYAFAELLSALPPEFPLDGHLHVREASLTPDGTVVTQRGEVEPGVSPAGSSDSR